MKTLEKNFILVANTAIKLCCDFMKEAHEKKDIHIFQIAMDKFTALASVCAPVFKENIGKEIISKEEKCETTITPEVSTF